MVLIAAGVVQSRRGRVTSFVLELAGRAGVFLLVTVEEMQFWADDQTQDTTREQGTSDRSEETVDTAASDLDGLPPTV